MMIKREEISIKAPKTSGIYYLYSKRKRLVYVGRARKDIRSRLKQHNAVYEEAKKWIRNRNYKPTGNPETAKPFDFFRFTLVTDKVELDRLEQRLIKALNPRFNHTRTFVRNITRWEDLLDKL